MERRAIKRKASVTSGAPHKRRCLWNSGDMARSTCVCESLRYVPSLTLSTDRCESVHTRERKLQRQAIKIKGSVASGAPNKRRWLWNSADTEKPTCSGILTLLMLIIGAQDSYMKMASGLYQFINTCVPDTLLASFHFLYMKHLHIRALLALNDFFKVLMDTLNGKKYAYARALLIGQQEDSYKLDRFGNIKDYFPVIDQLVCAKVDYHQETPSAHPIYEKTLSKFRALGDLRALGDISDPALILVHRDVNNRQYDRLARYIPPLAVIDDNKRKFELEVLLVGKNQHMFMYYKLSDSMWIRYDNTPGIPFQFFNFKSLSIEDVCICSAIYVNTSQAEDYKHKLSLRPDCGLEQYPCSPKNEMFLSTNKDNKDHESMQDLEMILQNLSI